jgi:hypothetical protein
MSSRFSLKIGCDTNLMEGQEWCVAHDDRLEMIVLLVQPSKDVEDKVAVGDHAVESPRGRPG